MSQPKELPMPAAEHAQLRAFLQGHGLQAADLVTAVGAAPGGRSRKQVEAQLTAWLRNRPKG